MGLAARAATGVEKEWEGEGEGEGEEGEEAERRRRGPGRRGDDETEDEDEGEEEDKEATIVDVIELPPLFEAPATKDRRCCCCCWWTAGLRRCAREVMIGADLAGKVGGKGAPSFSISFFFVKKKK